jgi:hypothetical protein
MKRVEGIQPASPKPVLEKRLGVEQALEKAKKKSKRAER